MMGETFPSYMNFLTMKNYATSANQTVIDLHSAFPRSNLTNRYMLGELEERVKPTTRVENVF